MNSQASFWSGKKQRKDTFFPILHHLCPVIFANTTVVAFVMFQHSRFNFHRYTQHEPMRTQKLAWKWQLWSFATSCMKDYKGHSLAQTSFPEPPNSKAKNMKWMRQIPKKITKWQDRMYLTLLVHRPASRAVEEAEPDVVEHAHEFIRIFWCPFFWDQEPVGFPHDLCFHDGAQEVPVLLCFLPRHFLLLLNVHLIVVQQVPERWPQRQT